jgi:hypothetical protein
MLNIYTSKDLLKDKERYVRFNDSFFIVNTITEELTDDDIKIIKVIDNAVFVEVKGNITDILETPYGYSDKRRLSTGCKAILNILHHREKVFECAEVGENVQRFLASYCYKKNIDVDIVYKGYFWDIAEGVKLKVNGNKIVRDKVEFMEAVDGGGLK